MSVRNTSKIVCIVWGSFHRKRENTTAFNLVSASFHTYLLLFDPQKKERNKRYRRSCLHILGPYPTKNRENTTTLISFLSFFIPTYSTSYFLTHIRRMSVRDTVKVVCICWARTPQWKGRIKQLQKHSCLIHGLSLGGTKEQSSLNTSLLAFKTLWFICLNFCFVYAGKRTPSFPCWSGSLQKILRCGDFCRSAGLFQNRLVSFCST